MNAKPSRIRRGVARIRGMGYILWTAKHELFHILLGLMWAWALREQWHELNSKWIFTAVLGSLLPDADHFVYFFTYGRRDPYTKAIFTFLKNHEWRVLVKFMSKGHKYNTNLTFHNYYITGALFVSCILAYVNDWRVAVVLLGAMLTHYIYDIVEDFLYLGHANPNWKRIGRGKGAIVGPSYDDVFNR